MTILETNPAADATATEVGEARMPKMLSHLAYVTPDAKATADFYTNVMKMEYVNGLIDDNVTSTGDPIVYFHIFFRMADGSTVAFFEAPDLPARAQPAHPVYRLFDHLALQVETPADVDAWKVHLEQHGIEVVGPTDHEIIYSIYFYDPVNDIRLEITAHTDDSWNNSGDLAAQQMDVWERAKAEARELGLPAAARIQAMLDARRTKSPK